MKLTPRLAAIADLVPVGSVVADIGTDHGYLPVYLLSEGISQRVIASDVNKAPLDQARETVAALNCTHKVDLRLGNGLHVLRQDDNPDTVIIAGMGGRTITLILEEGRHKLAGVERFILQPMSEAGYLRLFLAQNGFALVHESLAMEGKRLYEIILAKPGKEMETDPFRLSFGPRLLEKKPELFPVLVRDKIRKLRIVYFNLQNARHRNMSEKIKTVEKELMYLEEVLAGAVERADID
jgi:tRNA (adenine22-N1)-methyltransferase